MQLKSDLSRRKLEPHNGHCLLMLPRPLVHAAAQTTVTSSCVGNFCYVPIFWRKD